MINILFLCTGNSCRSQMAEGWAKKLGVDLVNKPELACQPDISTKIACQYFKERGLLELADAWNLDEITRKVNGNAKLHHDIRVKYSEAALKELGG